VALDRRSKLDPLNNKTHIANPDGTPTAEFMRQWNAQRTTNSGSAEEIAQAIADAETALAAAEASETLALALAAVQIGGDATDITPGPAALSDGNITLSLTDTAVSAGTYGDDTNVPQITVDAKGRVTAVTDVPISGGGGGGSIVVDDDGVTVVASATTLNFAGAGVVVTDNGAGEALITIAGSGGGGGVPTIVQSKAVGVSNLSIGITLDAPPTEGNILVAVAFNCAANSSTSTAPGWIALNSSGSTPDPTAMYRVVGPAESATQTPSNSTHGGAIAIIEIAGATVKGNSNLVSTAFGTATTVPFTDDNEFLPVASGLGIGFAGGRTANTITWNGVFTEAVQGNFPSSETGGVNPGSVTIATFTLNPGGSPAGGITVPSTAFIFACWALFR